jgi:hypothetical protein
MVYLYLKFRFFKVIVKRIALLNQASDYYEALQVTKTTLRIIHFCVTNLLLQFLFRYKSMLFFTTLNP